MKDAFHVPFLHMFAGFNHRFRDSLTSYLPLWPSNKTLHYFISQLTSTPARFCSFARNDPNEFDQIRQIEQVGEFFNARERHDSALKSILEQLLLRTDRICI
jgi:hypothetical protein